MLTARQLTKLYQKAHNIMRDVDGLQPQEAFNELLKYMFFNQNYHGMGSSSEIPSVMVLRKLFRSFLGKTNSWTTKIWGDKKIYLSDACLTQVHELLFNIQFNSINYDVRSHALKEFLTPDIRKGLGIFLTPDDVVTAIIEYSNPEPHKKVLDPACGSGTFLIEFLKNAKKATNDNLTIFGFDKNPRMLLLADLNLKHIRNVVFEKTLQDSIRRNKQNNEYDFIFTNPPFGVNLDSRSYDFSLYKTCQDKNGYYLKSQTSEVVFIERCLHLLKPGGFLAIVLPKSIATNNNLQIARDHLSELGFIYTIMVLPPETFAATGTQTTTMVLFIKKYKNAKEKVELIDIPIVNISNVGYDSTGREREGNELPSFAKTTNIALTKRKTSRSVGLLLNVNKSDTFKNLSAFFIRSIKSIKGVKLTSICKEMCTGRTPARSSYTEQGYFLVKVGNLSGAGISWEARDRNFVSEEEIKKRINSLKPLVLRKYDILMTSSAHSPVYIAKKIDIFLNQPSFISGEISFVGEVMLIRPDVNKINPFLLLAYLRHPETMLNIQKMIRGQTAHLHSKDLGELIIPDQVFTEKSPFKQIAKLIEEQTLLSEKLSLNIMKQNLALSKI